MSELRPGRELDALVAEKVMGLEGAAVVCPKCESKDLRKHWLTEQHMCSECTFNLNYQGKYFIPAPYSTDISAAWEVVDRVRSMLFSKRNRFEESLYEQFTLPSGHAIHPRAWIWQLKPHHICLAALKAVESTK